MVKTTPINLFTWIPIVHLQAQNGNFKKPWLLSRLSDFIKIKYKINSSC